MRDTLRSRVRLGVFEVDLQVGELREGERTVLLQEQPFRILRMLIERGGDLVTREEIKKKFWPNDTVVEFDHSINAAIRKLRRALDDSADDPRYIETIPRRGYRLIVPVEWLVSAEGSPAEVVAQNVGSTGIVLGKQPDSGTLSGRTVSHYRVLDVIGGGGMGVVYRAEDLKLGRRVALKFLPEELGSDPQALERFSREARTASSLDHPNICPIFEFGEHEGRPFLVMQLLEGETLRDRLASSEGPLPLEELLDLAVQISDGLQAAHERGIIHRDIKPANIFITDKGVCRILDFGVAKLLEEAPGFSPANLAEEMGGAPAFRPANRDQREIGLQPRPELHLTRTGSALGTAGYMSPEQVRGEKLDARTDIFSFGLVLYELATGQRAFSGETAELVHSAILNDAATPICELNSTLPEKLASTIDKALKKDRGQRYQSAAEMRVDLEQVRIRSESKPAARSTRYLILAAALALVVAGVAIAFHWRSRRVVKLTAKDTVLVADFNNSTGDPVFDGALRQALTSGLEQSPFLNVLPEQKVVDILKLMSRPANIRISGATAREACLRGNSKATLEGNIARAAQGFKIEVKAIDCQTGNTLAEAGAEAASQSDVLPKLGNVSRQLRQSLGESLPSVQTYSQPLAEVTTSSLEALQEFSWGRRLHLEKDWRESVPHYLRALELDPKFAQAHASLAAAYAMSGGSDDLVGEHLQKAYELRTRVSPRERFYIEGNYLEDVRGESSKALVTYWNWAQTFPQDPIPRANLAFIYGARGQWQDALVQGQFAIQFLPEAIIPRWIVEEAYLRLGDLSGAKRTFEETRAQNMDGLWLRYYRYSVAFAEGDGRAMQDQVSWAAGRPGAEGTMLNTQSETEAYYGHFDRSRQFAKQAVASAKRDGVPVSEVHWTVNMAWMEEEVGLQSEARKLLLTAPTISNGDEPNAAFVLARLGQTSQAQKIVDKVDRKYPFHEINHSFALALAQAAIAMENGDPNRAVALLEVSKSHELGAGALIPAYFRGLAFLQAGDPLKAAAEFQNVIAHPTLVDNRIIGALAHLQLGRARVMTRDKAAARSSYQDFLTLWKDADPDIPIYQQAKAEYARLQ